MKGFIIRISNFIVTLLGIDRLSSNFLGFARGHLTFTIAMNIQSVFVNILLLRSAEDISITLLYNIISYASTAFGMTTAGALVKKVNLKHITTLGISFYITAYALFLIFMNNIVSIYVLVAFLLGTGAGFFYLTYFNLISLYTEDESRDISIGFMGVVTCIISIIVPSVSGSVIGAFEDFTGYNIMFGCAFVVAGISMYLFIKLPRVETEKGKSNYKECFKNVIVNPCWRSASLQIIFRSIREGIFMFFLNVLLFEYVPNEAMIGLNALICGFIGMFAQYYSGKFIKPNNRTKTMIVATTVLLGVCATLFFGLNAYTVLLLSFVNAFFVVLLMNPALSIDFLVIGTMPGGYENRNENFAIFEICRNIGRIIGVCLIIIFPKTPTGYIMAMLIVTSVQYLTVVFSKRVERNVANYVAENMQEQQEQVEVTE